MSCVKAATVFNVMDDRAQGAFEYILLLAGTLLIVVVVILILRNSILPQVSSQLNDSVGNYHNVVSLNCTGPNGTCYNLTGFGV